MLLLSLEPAEFPAALALGAMPVPAGDVRDLAVIAAVALLELTAEHGTRRLFVDVEQTGCVFEKVPGDVGVDSRGSQTAVARSGWIFRMLTLLSSRCVRICDADRAPRVLGNLRV